MKTQNTITFSILLLTLLSLCDSFHARPFSTKSSNPFNISAIFAFGDSTLDSGNNNRLLTLVRADHAPYGQNFPGGVATGRFSNGKLLTDFLASGMQLKDSLPAYLSGYVSPRDSATGMCFASAGSGIDDLTSQSSNVASMGRQIDYFNDYVRGLNVALGKETVDQLIHDALFVIGSGSNDMIMNYYMFPVRKMTYNLTQYHDFLQSKLSSHIQQLYNMGARKFTVAGLPPIGCIPLQITTHINSMPGRPRTCVDEQNEDAMKYNTKLLATLGNLQSSLTGSLIVYADIYDPLMDMINNPKNYGFTETTLGCCGTGLMEMGPLCSKPLPNCPDPSKYMFWDSVHPSEAAYEALAKQFMQLLPIIFH
ncbi:hypothetical protein J5N97_014859 [Dioscorea zingiberensis]|uniref:GDSL esterase/lipase n=1 Tax=Dioscorea zingiberensis TaxID=325984 RepID=A0A9D5CT41_9LILI|nr:hypothetical protein J5N97_014859 [Dioscorea zingiberensis]